MESTILQAALEKGIFAALFCYLLWYVLKENAQREKGYQAIIRELSDKFSILESIKSDIQDLKDILKGEKNE